jgi:gluconolactonase
MDIIRYPDARIQVLDPAFARLRINNAAVERLATGFRWAEGPVWFGDGRFCCGATSPTTASCSGTNPPGR